MKKLIITTIIAALLLSGCGNISNEGSSDSESNATTSESGVSIAPITATTAEASREETEENLEDMQIDPPYDFDVDSMKASDFGDYFKDSYSCSTSSYTIGSGENEHEVKVIKSSTSGPTVYVIAGIHGDEEAAWQAGKLLKNVSIKCGTLYIIAPANNQGAKSHSRYIDGKDPNRVWPGSSSGNAAQQNAYAIYTDVLDKEPDFVFDLHEARVVEEGRDFLGNSVIYSDLDLFPDGLFLDLIEATQKGEICSHYFNSYSPGPKGSVNRTITQGLKIPTMTVETFRGYQMRDRIADQLDVVNYVLEYYGME